MRKDAAMKRTVATVGLVCALMINANRLPTVAVAGSCNKISKNEEWETYYPHYLAVRNNIRVAMEIL